MEIELENLKKFSEDDKQEKLVIYEVKSPLSWISSKSFSLLCSLNSNRTKILMWNSGLQLGLRAIVPVDCG